MAFDWTLNVGHVLTIVGFVGAIVGFYIAMRADIMRLNDRMATMAGRMINVENKIDHFSEALIQLARQDERLGGLDKRMDDMQRAANEWRAWARPLIEKNGIHK